VRRATNAESTGANNHFLTKLPSALLSNLVTTDLDDGMSEHKSELQRLKEDLTSAVRSSKLVRLRQESGSQGWIDGYVLSVGKSFVCLAIVDNNNRPDGFSFVRLIDVTSLDFLDAHDVFVKKFWKLADLSVPQLPSVELGNMSSMFLSLAKLKIIVLYCDGICHVGRIVEIKKSNIYFYEISTDAEWDNHSIIPIKGINKVNICGAYEAALLLVAEAENHPGCGHGHLEL
jgi:hypothetical protein